MIRSVIWTVLFCIAAAIVVQSAIIGRIPYITVKPDIALCILVFSAYVNGTMTGQVSGFFSGIFIDFISAAPLGLNCIVRTITGALAGIFKGKFFLDYIIMPVILCAMATVLKAVIYFILHLFSLIDRSYSITSSDFWIELGINALIGPLIFLLLRKFKPILAGRN